MNLLIIFIASQVVVLAHMVQEPQHIVQDHDVITGCHTLDFIHPKLDHIKAALQQVQGRHLARAGNTEHLVDDGLFHVVLNSLQHDAVSDLAEGTYSWALVLSSFSVMSLVRLLVMVITASFIQDISLMVK